MYGFESYREGQYEPRLPSPRIGEPILADNFSIAPAIYLENVERFDLALSAVIEETDGTKSYWALRHPPGKPDFHHPDCFALTRSEEHTSELQSLMRISYAVFCL